MPRTKVPKASAKRTRDSTIDEKLSNKLRDFDAIRK